FAIYDNGSPVFKVSQNQIESAVPHTFTAAGDVSIAYDLLFSNQTAANIKSNGPLLIQAGENFESNNLTLQTYNSGNVIIDNVDNGTIATFSGATTGNRLTLNGNLLVGATYADSGITAPVNGLIVQGN